MLRNQLTLGILAGGQGLRVGGEDKGLLALNGRPLIEWTMAALQKQFGGLSLLISANRNVDGYARYAPVVTDAPNCAGPLAGISALLERCTTEWLLTIPCDCPVLPPNFGEQLAQFVLNAEPSQTLAVVNDGARNQNVFLLLRKSLAHNINANLEGGGAAVHPWLKAQAPSKIVFADWPSHYWNANTVDALQTLIDGN